MTEPTDIFQSGPILVQHDVDISLRVFCNGILLHSLEVIHDFSRGPDREYCGHSGPGPSGRAQD